MNTPRTDAAEWDYYEDCTPEDNMVVLADFARQLESELATMTALADRMAETLSELMAMRHKCFIPNEGDWWDNKASAALISYKNQKKQTP